MAEIWRSDRIPRLSSFWTNSSIVTAGFSVRRPSIVPQAGDREQASLCQDAFHYVAVDVGEPVVAAGVAVGEALVIDAHQMKDGGVQVVNVDLVANGVPAKLVCGAVGDAALDAAAGQPHGKAKWVVVAAV